MIAYMNTSISNPEEPGGGRHLSFLANGINLSNLINKKVLKILKHACTPKTTII